MGDSIIFINHFPPGKQVTEIWAVRVLFKNNDNNNDSNKIAILDLTFPWNFPEGSKPRSFIIAIIVFDVD